MSVACGSCAVCREKLVYIAWREGKRKVIVACHDCEVEMQFDLESLLSASEPLSQMDEILENFVPKGRPS